MKAPLLTGIGASDQSQDNYHRLAAQVRDLEAKVQSFSQHIVEWLDQARRTNKAQRRLLSQWRATYRVAEAEPAAEERLQSLSSVLRKHIDGPWQRLDTDLRSSVLPMLVRLTAMFQNPKAVMAKRDIRESDYSRYRSSLKKKGNETPDRKLLESANAFVALHAQLLDELPQFIYGVQTLLDIGVQALARLQATYFLSTKRELIDFWRDFNWGNEGDISLDEVTQEPTMRQSNPVRQFWESHQQIVGYAETLGMCAPSVLDDEDTSPSRTRFASPGSNLVHGGYDDSASTVGGHSSSLHPDAAGPSRLAVAGLVRNLSANRSSSSLAKSQKNDLDNDEEEAPPIPPLKVNPPLLPQLEFKSGFFVVEGSTKALPFLDSLDGQPYDLSPSPSTKELPSVDDELEAGGLSKSESLPMLSASNSSANNTDSTATQVANSSDDPRKSGHARRRTQFKVVCVSAAVSDSPKRDADERRMGWPYLEYKVGDPLSLLSHDMEKSGYLFGRNEKGEMGWAESDSFVELDKGFQ